MRGVCPTRKKEDGYRLHTQTSFLGSFLRAERLPAGAWAGSREFILGFGDGCQPSRVHDANPSRWQQEINTHGVAHLSTSLYCRDAVTVTAGFLRQTCSLQQSANISAQVMKAGEKASSTRVHAEVCICASTA